MISPTQLVAALAAQQVEVSERALTDWRAKGLLPALTKIGRGRGLGTINGWASQEITDQARLIHRLLARRRSSNYALTQLFFSGYDVPVLRAKEAWLANAEEKRARYVKRAQNKPDGFVGLIQSWSKKLIAQNQPYQLGSELNYSELLREVLGQLYDPKHSFDSDHLSVLLVETFDLLESEDSYETIGGAIEIAREILPAVLSRSSDIEIISTATENELRQIQKTYKIVRASISHLLETQDPKLSRTEVTGTACRFCGIFGALLGKCEIQTMRHGFPTEVGETANILSNWILGFTEESWAMFANTDVPDSPLRESFSEPGKRIANLWEIR